MEELVLQAFHHGGLERCLPGGELLDESSSVDDYLEWCGIHDEVRNTCVLSSSYYLPFPISNPTG